MPMGVYKRTAEHRKKLSDNSAHYWKNKERGPQSDEHKKKLSMSRNGKWKGGSRDWWHDRVWKLHGKSHCEHCSKSNEDHIQQTSNRLHMHCLSGSEYINYSNLDSTNWICLCTNCHQKLERQLEKECLKE